MFSLPPYLCFKNQNDLSIILYLQSWYLNFPAATAMNEAITQALEWMCSIEENLEPMRFNVKWSEKSMKKKIDEIKVSESIWRREPIRGR